MFPQQGVPRVAQRLPRAAPFRHVGVQRDETAFRQRTAAQFDHPVVGVEGLAGAEIAGAQQRRPALHFLLHIVTGPK